MKKEGGKHMVLKGTPTVDVERAMRKVEKATTVRRKNQREAHQETGCIYSGIVQTILLTLRTLWSTNYLTVLKSEIEILIH